MSTRHSANTCAGVSGPARCASTNPIRSPRLRGSCSQTPAPCRQSGGCLTATSICPTARTSPARPTVPHPHLAAVQPPDLRHMTRAIPTRSARGVAPRVRDAVVTMTKTIIKRRRCGHQPRRRFAWRCGKIIYRQHKTCPGTSRVTPMPLRARAPICASSSRPISDKATLIPPPSCARQPRDGATRYAGVTRLSLAA